MKHLLIGFAFFLTSLGVVRAQQAVSTTPWLVGITTGITSPLHDVRRAEYFEIGDIRYNLGLHVTHWFAPSIGVRAQAGYGSVTGEINQPEYIARLSLAGPVENQTSYYEFSAQALVNFSGLGFWAKADRKWNVFATVGLGLNAFDARVKDLTTGQFLQAENFGKAMAQVVVVPVGLGISYKVSPQFHIDLQGNLHLLNSDAFDGMVVQKMSGAPNEPNFGRNLDRYSTINLSFVLVPGSNAKTARYWGK